MTDQIANSGQIASSGTTQNTGDATAAATQPTPAEISATSAASAPTLLGGEATKAADTMQPAGQTAPAQAAPADATKTEAKSKADPGKPDGDKAPGEQEKQRAPEKYEFKAPEGVKLDDAVIGEFESVARELGLSQDAAQKLVEKIAPKMAERTAAQQAEAFAAFRADLVNQVKTDKELGGEKLAENLAVAKKALDNLGTPALRMLLEQSGLGDHPEIIRMFHKAGKAISEDGFVPGGKQPGAGEQNAATKLYGQSNT